MKFQCYYNETVWYNGVAHTGKRVDTECFYTEEEAEKYCRWNTGITEYEDGTYEEHEMHYEEIEEWDMDIEKFWRYSLDCGGGGIVIADTVEEAVYKIKAYYNSRRYGQRISLNKDEIIIWPLLDDDFYDSKHPDIIDCY